MVHRLYAPPGQLYLSPQVALRRLESEFSYVETDEEDGRRHVRKIIRQLWQIKQTGKIPIDDDYLQRLNKAQRGAVYVYFGDNPGSEMALLSTVIIPGEPLIFDYSSRAHRQATQPLLLRCASVLGYDITEM